VEYFINIYIFYLAGDNRILRSLRLIFFFIIFIIPITPLKSQIAGANISYGDRLKLGYVYTRPIHFSPLIVETAYEREFKQLVFGYGLFRKGQDDIIEHAIAVSSKQEDARSWIITIRNDVKFHDLSILNAEDVRFTFNLYKKFALQSPELFVARLISTIEIISPQSLRIVFRQPVDNFRETLGLLPILPEEHYRVWDRYNMISNLPQIEPVGTGYFKFTGPLPDGEIHLDANLDHYQGRPYLDGIDITFFETFEALSNAFVEEKIDLMEIEDENVYRKVRQITESVKFSISKRPTLKLYYIQMNTQKPPFDDVNIRRALNFAVNKEILVNRHMQRESYIANNILEENAGEFLLDDRNSYKYDPLRSLSILESVGYNRGANGILLNRNRELRFDFYYQKGSVYEESIARLVAINLREIGVNVVPRPLLPVEIENRLNSGDYQAALTSFNYETDMPEETLRKFYFNELNRVDQYKTFYDRSINQLFQRAEGTLSRAQLIPNLQRIQFLLNQYAPCIFLFFESRVYLAIDDRFENTRFEYTERGQYFYILNPKQEWYVSGQHRY
jgi:peptide/nickel transport system substrate-binding protein